MNPNIPQLQLAELQVLKSIFGEDLTQQTDDPPFEFHLVLSFTPPPTFSFVMEQTRETGLKAAEEPSGEPNTTKSDSGIDLISQQVSFIPPIRLYCNLSPTYPISLFSVDASTSPSFSPSTSPFSSSVSPLLTSSMEDYSSPFSTASYFPPHFPQFLLSNMEWLPRHFFDETIVPAIREEILSFQSLFADQASSSSANNFDFLEGQCLLFRCIDRIRLSIEIFLSSLNPPLVNVSKNFAELVSSCEPQMPLQKLVEKYYGFILRYNHQRRMEVFRTSAHCCLICYSDKMGTDFSILSCGHNNYCSKCLSGYCSTNIQDGSVFKLQCPDPSCKVTLSNSIVESLVTPEMYQRWERLVRQKTLDSRPDITTCPRCEDIIFANLEDSFGNCLKCCYPFCIVCRDAYHPVSPCIPVHVKLTKALGTIKDQQKERNKLNELKNLAYVEEHTKRCPSCGSAVEKFEGCNKITCAVCSKYFCYICGRGISGYDHFKSGSCLLFDMDFSPDELWFNLNRPNNERNRRIRPAMLAGEIREKACPSCGQKNIRESNNNHVTCWACRKQFCFQCGSFTKGTGHFINSACKQHSN